MSIVHDGDERGWKSLFRFEIAPTIKGDDDDDETAAACTSTTGGPPWEARNNTVAVRQEIDSELQCEMLIYIRFTYCSIYTVSNGR